MYVVLVVLFSFSVPVHALYTAAVVEFSIDQVSVKARDRHETNLKGFKDALTSVKNEGMDVILFPEDGINGAAFFTREQIFPFLEEIPDALPVIPCNDSQFEDRFVLQTLSCLAREFGVVLIANMGERKNCSSTLDVSCPPDGRYQFNTNVVLEKNGALIAKYHKINLYSAENDYFDPGDAKQCVSFKTSFGVEFGTFTCYDMLFDTPSQCLLSKGIKNFVFPTAWGNSFAFYMSTSVQQGWSRENQVNVLAANWHIPALFHGTGSGIYSAGVAKKYMFSGEFLEMGTGRVLVSKLEADPSRNKNLTQVGILKDVAHTTAKNESTLSQFKVLTSNEDVVQISYENPSNPTMSLTCTLDYKMKSAGRGEHYAVGVFIGENPSNFFYAVCTLLKCSSVQCGKSVKDHVALTVFERISLNGTFPPGSSLLSTALASGLVLLNTSEMKLAKNSLSIVGVNEPILEASLWTRVYP